MSETLNYLLPLPDVDEFGTPLTKMPNCPHCGEDELGMMSDGHALCYRCQSHVSRMDGANTRITDAMVRCNNCRWIGRVLACESGDEGELLCPQCLTMLIVKVPLP